MKTGTTDNQVVDAVKAAGVNQDRFAIMQQLASLYNRAGGDTDGLGEAAIKADERFARLRSLMKTGTTDDQVVDAVKAAGANQDRFAIIQQLASLYNRAGGDTDGLGEASIKADERFAELRSLMKTGTTDDQVVDAVKAIAMKCDATFWKNYNKLVTYKNAHLNTAIVEVDGVSVLVVNADHDQNLYQWLSEMNGYANAYKNHSYYGVKAYMRMGSLEQLALEEIGVTFDPKLHNNAMNARIKKTQIDRSTEHHGAESVDTGVALRGDDSVGDTQLDQQANQLAAAAAAAAAKQRRREQREQRQRERNQQGGD